MLSTSDMQCMYFYDMNFASDVLLLHLINVIPRKKFLRLTMGFGYFMYSHSLVPVIDLLFSGRDKVGIRALIAIVELWCIVLCFLFTTAAIG